MERSGGVCMVTTNIQLHVERNALFSLLFIQN